MHRPPFSVVPRSLLLSAVPTPSTQKGGADGSQTRGCSVGGGHSSTAAGAVCAGDIGDAEWRG